jgi:uncharacterized protein (DUF1501 family)
MNPLRRQFLGQMGACAAGAAIAAAAPRKTARKDSTPTLIAVYLRGGADALAAVVPFADKHLRSWRPSLAMPDPASTEPNHLLALDDTFAFNPNWKDLHKIHDAGYCAPLVCVGSPHPTRSHFDAQDFMERGAPGEKLISTGWLNRYLRETASDDDANLRAISLQPLLPRALRGPFAVLARPDDKAQLAMATYARLYAREKPSSSSAKKHALGEETRQAVAEFGARTIEQLRELHQVLEQSPAPTVKYPASHFARQLADIAKVIKANRGLEVTAIDYGGWDHHIDEGPVTGQLGKMLADVSASTAAFFEDLAGAGKNVVMLVMTEFGRTVKENGNRGTDHGHGGFMLAIGGRVQGKRVYGKWSGLDEDNLYDRRDLPVHTDFRVVFAEVLRALFDFDATKAGLFPGYVADAPPMGFMA